MPIMAEPAVDKRFYGRSHELDLIKNQLRRLRFLSLVSPGQRGKSALLIEGLIPQLIHGSFHGMAGPYWKVAHVKADEAPFAALAHAFSRPGVLMQSKVSPDFEEMIERGLQHGTTSLARLYRSSAQIQHFNLLIVIDDFERLLDEEDVPDGEAFIQVMTDALEQRNLPLYVIISIHPQALPLLLMDRRYKPIAPYVESSQFHLHFLNQSDLALALNESTRQSETPLDEDVRQQILDDLYFDEEQLDRLREYLGRLRTGWQPDMKSVEKQKRPKIKIARESDSTQDAPKEEKAPRRKKSTGAKAEVDKIYDSLQTKYQQTACKSIFLALVEVKESGELAFPERTIEEIAGQQDIPEKVALKVIEPFREAGIISGSAVSLTSRSRVTIEADANIEHWGTLRAWLDEDETNRKRLEDLLDRVEKYTTEDGAVKHLLTGDELAEVSAWWEDQKDDLELQDDIVEAITIYLKACAADTEADRPRIKVVSQEKKEPVAPSKAPKAAKSQIRTSGTKDPDDKPSQEPSRRKIVIKKRK